MDRYLTASAKFLLLSETLPALLPGGRSVGVSAKALFSVDIKKGHADVFHLEFQTSGQLVAVGCSTSFLHSLEMFPAAAVSAPCPRVQCISKTL